jgi:hypothetical protein
MNNLQNSQINLPANTSFHKAMEARRSSMLSNIANASKHFFRFTIDIIVRAVKHILGKDTTGPSDIQKAISIRTTSATNMLNNVSLPLDGNKNLRAHRASLKEMLNIYPDATAVSLLTENEKLTQSTEASSHEISPDNKKKCIRSDIPPEDISNTFKKNEDIFSLVDHMIYDIEDKKQVEFKNNKEIKIIIETPLFTVSEQDNSFTAKDCAQAYITACEAWQLYLQTKYNKKVTILPFSPPEDINNNDYAVLTKNNNNAYDSANAKLATIKKKDREIELLQYISTHIYNNQPPNARMLSSSISDDHIGDSITPNIQSDNDNINDNVDDISHTHSPLSPITGFYDNNTQVQDTKRILAAQPRNEDDLNKFLEKVKGDCETNKQQDRSYKKTSNFRNLKKNAITMLNPDCDRISDTSIYRKLTVHCYNSEDESRKLEESEVMLSDINKDRYPQHKDHFFVEFTTPIVSSTSENHLKHEWNMCLRDFQGIDEFSKEHNVDSGEAVVMYFQILKQNLFNPTELNNYTKGIKPELEKHIKDVLKTDSTHLYSICNLDLVVDLSIPKEFLDALENSKNDNISALVKEHGAANVLFNILNS